MAEIHRLIDEQLAALKDKFTTDEAQECSERARRISELLDMIATSKTSAAEPYCRVCWRAGT